MIEVEEESNQNKKALVLGAGGVRGVFQIGVLRKLITEDENLDYDILTGISAGALNAGFLACGTLKEMLPELEHIWLKEIKGNSSIWRHHLWLYIAIGIIVILLFIIAAFISFILTAPKWLTILFVFLSMTAFYIPYRAHHNTKSIYTTEPLKEIIDKYLDLDKLRSSGKILRIGAVSYEDVEYRIATEYHPDIKDWVLASSTFPVFFPMPVIDDKHWWDGGVINVAPLAEAIALGATEIDIILTNPLRPGKHKKIPGVLGQIIRALDILSNEILVTDIKSKCYNNKNLKVRLIMPDKELTDNSLNFETEKIENIYKSGLDGLYTISTYN